MKKKIIIPVLALMLVAGASVRPALAYFTTYAEAQGAVPLTLGMNTEITEEFSAWTKSLTVQNKEGSSPIFVRAKAFGPSPYTLTYSDDSGKWTPGADGYYYYQDVVDGGESTDVLKVKIDGVPEDVKKNGDFNVVVIYESTLALVDAEGKPYADWNAVLDVVKEG